MSVLAVVAGVTTALFSDSKSIVGNSVATGTLELTLNHSAGKPWAVSGMKPGDVTGWESMDIFNGPYSPSPPPSQLPFEAKLSLNKTGGSDALWNYLRIELKTSGWDNDCTNGDGGERTIHNGLVNTYTNGTVVSDIAYWHLANEDDSSGPPDNIRAGWSERICQRVGVDNSADNSVQGSSVTFDEVVDAVQDDD